MTDGSSPQLSVERFGAGEEAASIEMGDVILTHRQSPIARLIRLSQAWRFRSSSRRVFAYWSHCALIVDADGTIVEAEATGVQRNRLSKYRDTEYHLVRLGPAFPDSGRSRAAAYAEGHVGKGFGFLVMFSLVLWLTTGWRIKLARADHQICSGLVAHALQEGGQLTGLDATFALPADVAAALDVRP